VRLKPRHDRGREDVVGVRDGLGGGGHSGTLG
jgi:hypothetical protein